MNLDVEDIFAGTLGSIILKIFLFLLCMWIGSTIGAIALVVGGIIEHGSWHASGSFSSIWFTPLLGFRGWGLLNLPFLLCTFVFFVVTDHPGYRAWGIFTGAESLAVMVGWAHETFDEWLPLVGTWTTWIILLGMFETGVWLIYQMRVNDWAHEIGLLRMQNQQRRTEEEITSRLIFEKTASAKTLLEETKN